MTTLADGRGGGKPKGVIECHGHRGGGGVLGVCTIMTYLVKFWPFYKLSPLFNALLGPHNTK